VLAGFAGYWPALDKVVAGFELLLAGDRQRERSACCFFDLRSAALVCHNSLPLFISRQ
jgi:hypothetical protein